MTWTDSPDITADDVFSPSLKLRANMNVFAPNGYDTPPDENGHYESNTSRSNFHYAKLPAGGYQLSSTPDEAYKPTLLRTGEAPGEAVRPTAPNPYAARLTDLGNQLQSAYAAPHAGTARQILGALFARKNPALGGLISGETQRQRKIEPLQQEYGLTADIANRQYAQQKTLADIYKSTAEGGKFAAEAGAVPTKMALEQAQTEAANYKDDPNLGLIDLRTKQPVNPAGMAPLTKDEADVLGKQEGDKVPLKLKNTANEIVNRGYTTVNTEEGVYERKRGASATDMTRLGANPRMVFSPENRIVPGAADPYNPGNLTYMRAGEAMRTGAQAPGSSSVQAAKGIQKSATSGKIGEEINAFNTALQHADLLKQAVGALNNGDTRTLNSLKNRFQTEFGSSDVTNFQAIASAYSREITKMLSSGHMTDSEIGSSEATLPKNASPQQLIGAINAYKALASSKMNMRKSQVEKGMKGQPNFPAEAPVTAGKPTHIWTPQGLQPATP